MDTIFKVDTVIHFIFLSIIYHIAFAGFVISRRRIVTNAHVVADQTFVLVRKHGSPIKYRADVEAVGHECDLALLRVHDEEFWEGMIELELGEIPFLQESVAVVGYPQGIEEVFLTVGIRPLQLSSLISSSNVDESVEVADSW